VLDSRRVQTRHTLRADGTDRVDRFAFCPESREWTTLARCRTCVSCAHVSGEAQPVLVCYAVASPTQEDAESVRGELAASVWCIEGRAPARLALSIPDTEPDAVVVDADGHAVGLLSREKAGEVDPAVLARDAMEPAVVALLDCASTESARSLVLRKGVRTLPVLSGGRVIGRVEVPEEDGPGAT